MEALPPEILVIIMQFTDVGTACNFRACNARFKEIVDQNFKYFGPEIAQNLGLLGRLVLTGPDHLTMQIDINMVHSDQYLTYVAHSGNTTLQMDALKRGFHKMVIATIGAMYGIKEWVMLGIDTQENLDCVMQWACRGGYVDTIDLLRGFGAKMPDGDDRHICATFSPKTMKYYIDNDLPIDFKIVTLIVSQEGDGTALIRQILGRCPNDQKESIYALALINGDDKIADLLIELGFNDWTLGYELAEYAKKPALAAKMAMYSNRALKMMNEPELLIM